MVRAGGLPLRHGRVRIVGVTPSNTGFRDAQRKLRAQFGEEITFFGPPIVTWPPDTPIDPQTGEPYDPTIEAVDNVSQEVRVKCNVVFTTAGPDVEFSAAGTTERTHVMLIADIDDAPAISPALEFECRGEGYRVTSQKADGIGGLQRYLVWGRKR